MRVRGVSKICLEETPYPFDLKENIEDVMEELKKADIDLSTASAVRERINDGKQGITEAVRITDRKETAACFFLMKRVWLCLNKNSSIEKGKSTPRRSSFSLFL